MTPIELQTQKPDNYLAWAIVSTVMCCLPTGVAAIVYSSKVDSLWQQGLYAEARDAAAKAKRYTILGAVISGVFTLLYILGWLVFILILANS